MNCKRYIGVLAAVALFGTFAGPAQARLSTGRTRAIRAGIARHVNQHPVAHVNWDIGRGKVTRVVRPSEIRFRSKRLPARISVVGSAERAVTWRLKSGMLAGTAQAATPVLPNGGKLTRIDQVRYTVQPRSGPPSHVQRNSRLSGDGYQNPKLEAARGHASGYGFASHPRIGQRMRLGRVLIRFDDQPTLVSPRSKCLQHRG